MTQAVPGVPMEALLVNQGPVGMILAEVGGTNPATGAYKYYTHDNIQSTRGLFEQNKTVAGTIEYTPYGQGYNASAPAGLSHRFTGLDLDSFTGQYYSPYRYYAPNLSRWLTRDPLGMVDGTNVFAYVRNAPVKRYDLLGLITEAECYAGFNYCTNAARQWLMGEVYRVLGSYILVDVVACAFACVLGGVLLCWLCIATAAGIDINEIAHIAEKYRKKIEGCEAWLENCKSKCKN